MIRCEQNCRDSATVRCTWGTDQHQTSVVCDNHARELWKFCESRVNAGTLFWINEELTQHV